MSNKRFCYFQLLFACSSSSYSSSFVFFLFALCIVVVDVVNMCFSYADLHSCTFYADSPESNSEIDGQGKRLRRSY